MNRPVCAFQLSAAAALALAASSGHAAGFHLLEQNASGLGNAYAGSAAIAENASTIYFNPAGMTYLPGLQLSTGVTFIKPSFKFRDDGQSRAPLALGGGAVSAGDDAGKLGVVPNAYLSWQVNDRLYAGIGFSVPFGLKTSYDDNWAGQYHSREFDIKTINVNPSIAYRINDKWSVGAGLNWQRIEAEYRKGVVLGAGAATDGRIKMKDHAWGWNVGVIYQASEATRLGLSYRSHMTQKATGHTYLGTMPGLQANTSVKLPDSAIFSVIHQLNPTWQLLADVSWTGWSSLSELRIATQGLSADVLPLGFRNTWRVALGANYRFQPQWQWKFGVAFDQTPVRSPELRTTALPDNNRWWFSTGVQYQPTARTTIDLGYTYLYLRNARIHNDSGSALTKGLVSGEYRSQGHIVGLQFSTRF